MAVLTGGYSEQELMAAVAVAVHRSLAELIETLADPPLGAGTGCRAEIGVSGVPRAGRAESGTEEVRI